MFILRSLRTSILAITGLLFTHANTFGYNLLPYRWDEATVPIFFRFDPGVYNATFDAAIKKWNAASPNIQLQNGIPGWPQSAVGIVCGEGGNSASFSYSVCGAPWGEGVLAITLVSYVNGKASHGDVLFNARAPFALYNGPVQVGSKDFGRVALHELGHFLGLDHEKLQTAIMRPKESDLENLAEDDKRGINARYPN